MNCCAAFAVVLLAIFGHNIFSEYSRGVANRDFEYPNGYNFHTTAEEVSEGVDLTGKVALVTGANSGLGFETARVFALRGAHVIAVARTVAKAEKAIAQLREELPAGEYTFTPLACDLGSLGSVAQAVADFKSLHLPLHYLMANAGIMEVPERTLSADGYEMHFAVNHLGHFHLVTALNSVLVASSPSRVVITSSLAHEDSPNPRDTLNSDYMQLEPEPKPYVPWHSYADSKVANIVFAKEHNERYKTQGVLTYSLHPGIIETNLVRQGVALSTWMTWLPKMPYWMGLEFGRTIPQGAATQVYAALAAPDSEAGQYLDQCNVQEFGHTYQPKDAGILDDAALRAKFWATSEKLVQQALAKL